MLKMKDVVVSVMKNVENVTLNVKITQIVVSTELLKRKKKNQLKK